MQHLLSNIDVVLGAWLTAHGQAGYRAGQVRRWLIVRRAASFAEMTDLPQTVREELVAEFTIWSSTIARHTQATHTMKARTKINRGPFMVEK